MDKKNVYSWIDPAMGKMDKYILYAPVISSTTTMEIN